MHTVGSKESIQLQKSTHTLIEPQIIKMVVKENEYIYVADVRKMHAAHLALSNNGPFCILLDTTPGYFNTSIEARKLIASKEYAKVMMASAFIVKSLAAKITGNFFLRFNKPNAPTKLFNNEKEALVWLRKFVKKT